jgi:hypothetical protein
VVKWKENVDSRIRYSHKSVQIIGICLSFWSIVVSIVFCGVSVVSQTPSPVDLGFEENAPSSFLHKSISRLWLSRRSQDTRFYFWIYGLSGLRLRMVALVFCLVEARCYYFLHCRFPGAILLLFSVFCCSVFLFCGCKGLLLFLCLFWVGASFCFGGGAALGV